ncbi:MAG: DNA replication/repair protein RecF [Hyphomicrobiaceae bacterium]
MGAPAAAIPSHAAAAAWVERLSLTNFRNYAAVELRVSAAPVVLLGHNGAGKTNLLEAVSLLAPGQGLRRAPYSDLARTGGQGDWAVAARIQIQDGVVDIGTGVQPTTTAAPPVTGRIVRIDGVPQSGSGALADHVDMAWLTPSMDGLFTGPAGDRRRFLDRLILCFDPGYRTRAAQFERAMRQRNRLLEHGVRESAQFNGLEQVIAETGVAIAAVRAEAVAGLVATIAVRRDGKSSSPFPWANIALDGELERMLQERPAIEVEDAFAQMLARGRERDRAAGRTLDGPHRTDLVVAHGPKGQAARLCSTGEQKALLIGLVLAHAQMLAERRDRGAPILLLDEIAAHLDDIRRAALFEEILNLGLQAWMTGTDRHAFAALSGRATFVAVDDGRAEVQG